MKVNIIKPHATYPMGEIEVTPERGKYLIRMGWAEGQDTLDPPAKEKREKTPAKEKREKTPAKEKREKTPAKEKREIKKP